MVAGIFVAIYLASIYASHESLSLSVGLLPILNAWADFASVGLWSSPGFVDSHGLESSNPARVLLS